MDFFEILLRVGILEAEVQDLVREGIASRDEIQAVRMAVYERHVVDPRPWRTIFLVGVKPATETA